MANSNKANSGKDILKLSLSDIVFVTVTNNKSIGFNMIKNVTFLANQVEIVLH